MFRSRQERKTMPRLSGRHVVYGVLLLASIVFLLYSVQTARTRAGAGEGLSAARTADAGEQRIAAAIPPAVPDDVDFGRYRDLARTNVFSDRQASAAPTSNAPPKAVQPLPDFAKPQTPARETTSTGKPPDFAGWTYAGYVLINGEKRGLLQNDSSETGKDLAVGEKFLGATVEEVAGRTIRLRSARSVTTLSIPELYPITPLDNSASAVAAARPRAR
jgi:hypothetical protein